MTHPKRVIVHDEIVRIHRIDYENASEDHHEQRAAYLLIPSSHHPAPIVDYRAKLHTDQVEQLRGVLVTPIVELIENALSTEAKDLDVQYASFDYDGYQYLMTVGYVMYIQSEHPDDQVEHMFPNLLRLDSTFVTPRLAPIPEGGFLFEKETAIYNYLEANDLEIPDELSPH